MLIFNNETENLILRHLLRVAIHHLIQNAIEAVPDDGEIIITTTGSNDAVKLSICDTGIGITTEINIT